MIRTKHKVKISGKTEDDKLVIKGILWLCSTHGISLTDILFELKKHNMVCDK